METPNKPDDPPIKDRFAGVPSLDQILASFAGGIQYAADHPDEVAAQQAEKQARWEAMLRNSDAKPGPVAQVWYRTTAAVEIQLYDSDTAARIVRIEEVPAGTHLRFTGEKHHVLAAYPVAEMQRPDGEADPATLATSWGGLVGMLAEADFGRCEPV